MRPTNCMSPTRPCVNANASRQLLRPRTRVTFASGLADVNATLVRVAVQLLARQIARKLMKITHRRHAAFPILQLTRPIRLRAHRPLSRTPARARTWINGAKIRRPAKLDDRDKKQPKRHARHLLRTARVRLCHFRDPGRTRTGVHGFAVRSLNHSGTGPQKKETAPTSHLVSSFQLARQDSNLDLRIQSPPSCLVRRQAKR